jgi:hypothetical protein
LKDLEKNIKENASGMRLGQWANDHYCVVVSNRHTHAQSVTTHNLGYTMLLKGLNFNTHAKYYETSNLIYKGVTEDIVGELYSDSIMFSLFYKGCDFSNKEGVRNYIVPFTADELHCSPNDLNVLFPEDYYAERFSGELPLDNENLWEDAFDFRKWIHQFDFSQEALELYNAALDIFLFYHRNDTYRDKDWNDSFYDIKNAIMAKDATAYQQRNTNKDRRVTKVKTAQGTLGFSAVNIRKRTSEKYWPMFDQFFTAQKALAEKINCRLLKQGLMLWKHENVI